LAVKDATRGHAMNARDIAEYVGEFTPTNATPTAPCCWCGGSVFYQLPGTVWLCRDSHPPNYTGWRTVACLHESQCDPPKHIRSAIHRWFVVPESRP
jgi:hypothetical protein